ncbi:geranylgeranyl diphosphate synthase, type I [Halopelagius inordinatus]|uniref:Geranylgeranyl diphosphate synthase, type I n=1 Tax=Halopelagius inordinatus TaxID=553467 RepID=A0A1I2REG2_9EURY|nr:polyprenyl synthetase family protein [Halopelagius inordinatus]SFG39064.1 geranylgeranyl diphosphate synthase, type I [Halopelagius inordinatus]
MNSEATEERVLEAVKQRRELVNDALDEDIPLEEPQRLYEATRYLLQAGGKRLRPTVTLLTAEALADVEPLSADYRAFPSLDSREIDVMTAAASIEVIQSFTLIHDDIMDDDDLRRGVPAVHKEYDTETAILAGDTLYAKAFELMTHTGADPENGLEAVRMLATTCTQICEGQAIDVEFERRTEVLPDEYLEMIELKTAVLYGAAAATAGVLMGASDDVVEALYRYGIDSGCAFQIQDDVLDLTVPSEKLGKQRGSDLVENKETMITLHARQQGVDVDGLLDASDIDDVTEAAVEEAVSELDDAGSIDFAREKAQELTDRAKDHLEVLPDNEARSLLRDIADYLITRGY